VLKAIKRQNISATADLRGDGRPIGFADDRQTPRASFFPLANDLVNDSSGPCDGIPRSTPRSQQARARIGRRDPDRGVHGMLAAADSS
jgi:hypothetical protein